MLAIKADSGIKPGRKDGDALAVIYGPAGTRDGDILTIDPNAASGGPITLNKNEKFSLEPTHDPKARDVIMVGGKSGSGKSFIAKNFIKRYHYLWPKRPIRLVSYLEEDETIDDAKAQQRIDADDWVDNPPDLEFFQQSLLVLDDVEGFERSNKNIFNAIQRVVDMIATTGRHAQASILNCSHLLTDYKRTRLWLGESNQFCVFPNGASIKQLNNLLGSYAGADAKEITAMRKVPSRWVCLRTSFPPVVIHETGAYLLHSTEDDDERPKKRGKGNASGLFKEPETSFIREQPKGGESDET
jgi:hypothetical protein